MNQLIQDTYYNQPIMEEPAQRDQQVVDKNKLYVSNLDAEVSNRKAESDLKQIFSKFGKIAAINVKRNQKYKKLYAFVVFYQASEAADAIDNLNGSYFGDTKIKVEYQKTQRQSRQQPREDRDGREVSRSGKYMNAVTCYRCGKVGHFARECRQKPENESKNRNKDRHQDNRHRRRSHSRSRSHDKKKRRSSSSSSSSSISEKKGQRSRSSSSSSSGSSSA